MPGGNELSNGVKAGLLLIAPYAVATVFPQASIKHHNRLAVGIDDVIYLIHAEKTRINHNRVTAQVEQVLDRLALFLSAMLTVSQ